MFLQNRLMSNFIANLFAVPAKPNWRAVQQNRYVCSDKKSQQIYSKYLPGVKVPDSCDVQLYIQVKNFKTVYSPLVVLLMNKEGQFLYITLKEMDIFILLVPPVVAKI